MADVFDAIPDFDLAAANSARARQDRLTKPTGSLGRLEELSIQLAGATGKPIPSVDSGVIFVYAADHGVAAAGVSAYPSEVTAQMVLNYVAGGAVINALARYTRSKLLVADVGVAVDLPDNLPILHRKVRRGTADWSVGPAMSAADAERAILVGYQTFQRQESVGLAAVGEMGIGNTATAAALAAAILRVDAAEVTGRGTGLDDAGMARKIAVVKQGLGRIPRDLGPLEILSELGGLEIAAMVGTILASAAGRVPVILDGFISTCAGLIATRLAPKVAPYLIASHRSPENGHDVVLSALKLTPILDLGMRLGEASGAALAIPIVQASARVLKEVATFDQAGVSDRPTDNATQTD